MSGTHARSKRRKIVALTAAFAVAGSGAAFAFWTATGAGNGVAASGTIAGFVVTSEAPIGAITPGGAGSLVNFTVTNPSTATQTLTTVTVTLADNTGTPWAPTGACLIADYNVNVTQPAPGPMLADGVEPGSVTVTLDNTGVNQDDCQGQVVPLYFVAS